MELCTYIIAERLSARHLILQHALGRCIFVRHALLSVTLLSPSRSIVRLALLRMRERMAGACTRVRPLDAEVRESTRLGLRARVGWKAGVR